MAFEVIIICPVFCETEKVILNSLPVCVYIQNPENVEMSG